jgi:hypothetical protein
MSKKARRAKRKAKRVPATQERGWRFIHRSGFQGRSYGNAALYATPQSIRSLVRETGQNSLDAAVGKGITLRYTLFELGKESKRREALLNAICFDDQLRPHIEAVAAGGGSKHTAVRLAAGLEELDASESVLRVLRIEDFGCTGLSGPEFGPEGAFNALLRDDENSQKKDQMAGGAYGLGSKTLWSCSKELTVLFSSVVHGGNPAGVRTFGKADLGFHDVDGGAEHGYVGAGFFGKPVGVDGAESEELPLGHRFLKDSLLDRKLPPGETRVHGTTALIIGFHDPTSDEEESVGIVNRLCASIAESFWPAIVLKQLRAHVDWFTDDNDEPTASHEIDPNAYVPMFAEAFGKHLADDTESKLVKPGDVVSVPVMLKVPATRPGAMVEEEHGDSDAECRLLIRLAKPDEEYLLDEIGYARSRAMVVKYQNKRGLTAGARPFHAFLLAGKLLGDDTSLERAERFLRFAEPPSHNDWSLEPGLRARYALGAGKRLSEFFSRVAQELAKHISVPPTASDEAPEMLKDFRLPNQRNVVTDTRVKLLNPKFERDGSTITAVARVKVDAVNGGTLHPTITIPKEQGAPIRLPLRSVKATPGTIENDRVRIPAGTTTVKIEIVAENDVAGIDLDRCALQLGVGFSPAEQS